MIHLESTTGDVIEDVTSEDLSTLTVGNPLIWLGTAAGNTVGCSGIAIRDYSRRGGTGGSGGGIVDIMMNAETSQVLIDKPTQYAGGGAL